MMVVQMLKDGLSKKMELLKQNPQNAASINKQIDVINKTIENYKNKCKAGNLPAFFL
jgi:aminopeptidase N